MKGIHCIGKMSNITSYFDSSFIMITNVHFSHKGNCVYKWLLLDSWFNINIIWCHIPWGAAQLESVMIWSIMFDEVPSSNPPDLLVPAEGAYVWHPKVIGVVVRIDHMSCEYKTKSVCTGIIFNSMSIYHEFF
jgi:hypothetical protein